MYGGTEGATLSGYTFSQLPVFRDDDFRREPHHADRGRMANRRRNSRRPMSFPAAQPVNTSPTAFNALRELPAALHGGAAARHRADLFLPTRSHHVPRSRAHGLAFAARTAMRHYIQFFIAYAIAMLAFWILQSRRSCSWSFPVEYFLSGQLFPLDMLPSWLMAFVKWTPFPYEMYFPVQIFMEARARRGARASLAIQAGWCSSCGCWPSACGGAASGVYQAVGA